MDTYWTAKEVCQLTIPPGYRYFIYGYVDISVSHEAGIMSSHLFCERGAKLMTTINDTVCRTTSSNGGGCVSHVICDVTNTDGLIRLYTHRYIDVTYTAYGTLYAIVLSPL